jgi:protocatechuate 3,4-dioxygenase beta subunit
LAVIAGAPGHGMARVELDLDAERHEVEFKLAREQVVRGRLFDLQGQPVKRVKVEVLWLFQRYPDKLYHGVLFHDPPQGLRAWPRAAVSDDQGRFELRGIGPDWNVKLHTRDERFARQDLESKARERKGKKELTWALAPARTAEGTLTYADTGKPVPHARLYVETWKDRFQGPFYHLQSRTDDRGRFRFVPPLGTEMLIHAYPPAGQPYLINSVSLTWAKADLLKKGIQVTLRRGILVRGTVTEKPSGRPVAGATVEFVRFEDNNTFANTPGKSPIPVTDARGRFELAVVLGPGHLLVKGPTVDYLHEEISSRKLHGIRSAGDWLNYPDALVALNLKPMPAPQELKVTLRRGVTVRGKVVGPDGKPVAEAQLVCRTYIPTGFNLNGVHFRKVKDGWFDLPGCDPEKSVPVFFLDVKNRLGAMVEMSGKQAAKPVTVRLQPCGTAKVRFVDGKGKPFLDVYPAAGVVLTEGVPFHMNDARKEVAGVAYPDRGRYKPDAQGRVTLPALIPGAKLWLSGTSAERFYLKFHREFKVEPGKTVDLGDIVARRQGEE